MSALDPVKLASVLRMLECCLAPDSALQAEAYAALQRYKADPEFLSYLSAVLAHPSDAPVPVRTVAGMAIKRIVDEGIVFQQPKPVQGALLRDLLQVLATGDASLRKTTANVISAIVRRVGVEEWPALLPALSSMLDWPEEAAVEGSLRCLHHLAEDAAALDSEALGHPLNELVPKLIRLMGSENADFRRSATECMREVSGVNCTAMAVNTEAFIQALAALTGDPTPGLRALVARCFTVVLGNSRPALWPHIRPVLAFIVSCLEEGVAGGGGATGVAMSACQFLSELAEVVATFQQSHPTEFMVPTAFFPRMCELLMQLCVYTDEDLALQQWPPAPDAGVPDKTMDVKPRFHKAGASGAGSTAVDTPGAAATAPADQNGGDDDDGDDDDEDEEDEDVEARAAVEKWTVRQEASNALETLAMVYKEEIARPLLPVLSSYLAVTGAGTAEWRRREAGILVLGAMLDPMTCYDDLAPHAAGLYPFLLDCTRDAVPQVRNISAWALGKMTVWIVEAEMEASLAEPGPASPIARLLASLCPLLGDPYKRVQASALECLTTLIESANEVMAPYLPALTPVLTAGLSALQLINRLLLYDVIGMLAEAIPDHCTEVGLFAALVPGLSARYAAVGADTDHEYGALLTCICNVLRAQYPLLREAAPAILARAFASVQGVLAADAAAQAAGEHEAGMSELLSTALDGIDSAVVGAGAEAPGLLAPFAGLLPEVLYAGACHTSPAVRRAALALLGDAASNDGVWPLLAPRAAAFIGAATPSMRNEPGNQDACNNAVWASGILVSRLGTVPPEVRLAVERVFVCLCSRNISAVLSENCVIFLGRVGCLAPADVGRAVPSALAAKRWFASLPSVTDPSEASYAFLGAAAVLQRNPGLIDGAFNVLAAALASYGGELNASPYPPEVVAAAQATLAAVLGHLAARGESIPRLMAKVPQGVYKKLNAVLGGQLPPRA